MSRRQRPWWLWALAGLVALAVLAGIVLAVWKLPSLLYGDVSTASPDARLQAASGFRTALVAGLGGLAALGSLAMATRTYRPTQQRQITERYTKAIDQLGSDKLETRLGGIYALERIAIDSERDHRTVIEVLGAFAREQSGQRTPPNNADVATVERGATDVEAAVTVLGRLPDRFGGPRANMPSVYLALAYLQEANLRGAFLPGANLSKATLSNANLRGAVLQAADLRGAELGRASLERASLQRASLERASLQRASLHEADLSMADLRGAYLHEAILWKANLQGANLWKAKLLEADLQGADLQEADLRVTDLRGANLRGAILDRVQLTGAGCNAATVWPDGFDRRAAGVIFQKD